MAYDPDRNYNQPPVNEYHRTTIERDSGGATWIVIGLLFAAIVAAIFFLFRPAADGPNPDTIILDPAGSEAPLAPAADVDVNVAPSTVAPADDAAAPATAAPDAAAPDAAAPAETAPVE